MNSHAPSHFQPQNGPRGSWPGPVKPTGPPGFPEQVMAPQLSEVEFEEIMARNRTVSSSAIARCVESFTVSVVASILMPIFYIYSVRFLMQLLVNIPAQLKRWLQQFH